MERFKKNLKKLCLKSYMAETSEIESCAIFHKQ